MAACKRLVQLGPSSGISFTKFRRFSSSEKQFDGSSMIFGSSSSSNSSFNRFDFRQISQLVKPNGKRVFLIDTLALVRRFKAQGVPSKQAEAITAAITEVLNDSLENVAHSFVSKAEMQKTDMLHESNLSKFKTEVQSSQGGNDFEIYDSERTVGHTASASPKPAAAGDSNCNVRNFLERCKIWSKN